MGIKDFFRKKEKRTGLILTDTKGWDVLCGDGYTPLDKCPEVVAGCRKIAEIVSSMTIHLMQNTKDGDTRLINGLSRVIDIEPCPQMTRKTFVESVVMNLLLYGRGNSIVKPFTSQGYLEKLEPVAASRVTIQSINYMDYKIMIDGQQYSPEDVLHFVYNPNKTYLYMGQGITAPLREIADNLAQASKTTKAFMKSEYKPSLIIKVDAMADEFSSPKGREKLLNEYITMAKAGQPWMIPAEQFQVEQVKPLTIADLAISDSVEIDKKTVASIIGVPAFVLGVGEYNSSAWNNFIQTKIKDIALILQQEMTKKLIYSPEWYLRFNYMSLMDWDISTLANVMYAGQDRGDFDGNEVRDKLGFSPREGLDELKVLENYIPTDMSGLQKKLIQKGDSNGE